MRDDEGGKINPKIKDQFPKPQQQTNTGDNSTTNNSNIYNKKIQQKFNMKICQASQPRQENKNEQQIARIFTQRHASLLLCRFD